ncbi:outer membrane protein [Bradyrhizobium sp. CIR3A]|uniref:outer membrane protein n=1 Tax=Bradyrhizobium sp. CIR3A TaxID=2663838 RepID=UPI0018030349|nr:outer membrane beta-barrel protein [Bradyrhizobium sp. CIR3A]MBB4263988.1 opacity protein-like surface antigen [Bradyrhizobium sp. CIR3A]
MTEKIQGRVGCDLEFFFWEPRQLRGNRCNECGRLRARSETATGGYIGGHVGGGYGRTSFSNPYGPSIYGDVVDTPVFLASGQIGYNWQKNGWVFGVELDASGAVSDGTNTCLAASGFIVSANCKAGPNVFATGTGRVGYAFGALGHTLAYLKGGVAWQNNRGDVVNNFEGGSPQEKAHFDYGRLGATIGLGVEQALTPAWSVKAEYDYLHFGGPSVAPLRRCRIRRSQFFRRTQRASPATITSERSA